jgi:4-amino-4-deoxy-L-arabinose transferase-like glycosyltransferase
MIQRLIQYIKANKLEVICLIFIASLAAFLRFYKITELHFFSFDQARDALISKRILVDHKWTLLGPQSSMLGVYLPPYYYYTLALVLWIFRLNPAGIDVYTAGVGVCTVILLWYIARRFFNKVPALMIAAFYATSPLIVRFSRQAWNPNTQPFLVLLILFFLCQLFLKRKAFYLILVSIFLGYAMNLHYSTFCLIPIWLFSLFWFLIKTRKTRTVFVSVGILCFFVVPLLLFDLHHHFMISRNISHHFFAKERMGLLPRDFVGLMANSAYSLFVFLLSGVSYTPSLVADAPQDALWPVFRPISILTIAHRPMIIQYYWWGVGLLGLIVITTIYFLFRLEKKGAKDVGLMLYLLIGIILSSVFVSQFYAGQFYFFYYLLLFPLPFLFLGFLFWFWWQKRIFRLPAVLLFILILAFNLRHALVLESPERKIGDIIGVSEVIAQDVGQRDDFVIAANYRSPDRWDHSAVDYRYFVEAYFGKRGLDWQPEDYRQAKILYVVAEGGLADPINSKIMEIYEFGPKTVEKTWELPKEVYIYKMTK